MARRNKFSRTFIKAATSVFSAPTGLAIVSAPFFVDGSVIQLAEAIDGSVESEENFENAGKCVCARSGKLFLIHFDFDARASRKGNSVLGDEPRKVRPAFQVDNAVDLPLDR